MNNLITIEEHDYGEKYWNRIKRESEKFCEKQKERKRNCLKHSFTVNPKWKTAYGGADYERKTL